MSDVIDDANDNRDRELEMRIAAARGRASQPPATECGECGEPPAEGSRFCCTECRDEFERRAIIRRRQGLK